MTVEEGLAALADAHAIDDDELREGADLWRMSASPDPRAFDEARRRGSSVFRELRESAELPGQPRLPGQRCSGPNVAISSRCTRPGRSAYFSSMAEISVAIHS